jgi:hypothetical protein
MTDQIKAAVEASEDVQIMGPVPTTVITLLAIYGAASLAQDVTRKARQIANNRKARKAAEVVETDSPQQ